MIDLTTHTEKSRELCLCTRLMRTRTRSDLQRSVYTHQQDVFFIPPPRAGGGAVRVSTPVSMGYSRVDPPSGSISCGTTMRGPSIFGRTQDAPQSVLHDAPDPHWYARPASIPSTVGRGNACPRRTVETVIWLYIFEQ